MLFGLGFVEIISLPHKGILREVILANHLAGTDNLTSNKRETERIQTQTNVNTKVSLINNNIHTKTDADRKDRQSLVSLPYWHQAKKWSGSILTTPEPARGNKYGKKLTAWREDFRRRIVYLQSLE